MGKGAQRLRRTCSSVNEIIKSIDDYVSDPLLRALHTAGAGPIASHPRYRHLQGESFSSICHLCWAMQAITPETDGDAVLSAAALLGEVDVSS